MIEYLFSSQLPSKGDLAETGLSSIIANIALVVGVAVLRPAIERQFHLEGHPTSPDNRFYKAVNTLQIKVKPNKPTIATAVTFVKAASSPVQIFQEQTSIAPILVILACMVLALIGTILSLQHYRQGASWSSSSAASSDNGDSSLAPEPYSRDPTPPNDDSSDESSGSDGHSPPVPIFDLFYNPILRLDKAVDTGDDQVRDEDGAPPPPPPSFPTPVEDGDGFKPSISMSLSLLVLSIVSFVIKRFFKNYDKTHEVFTPTVSERIAVNEISGDVLTMFPSATPTVSEQIAVNEISGDVLTMFPSATPTVSEQIAVNEISGDVLTVFPSATPTVSEQIAVNEISSDVLTVFSATPKPVFNINPTCPNLLPLVELETKCLSISTLVTSSVSQPSPNIYISLLFMTCLFGLPFILYYHLGITRNPFLPAIRRSLTVSVAGANIGTSNISGTSEDATGSDEANGDTGGDEEVLDLMKNSVQQEQSFNNVGDNTLAVFGKTSPLTNDLEGTEDAASGGDENLMKNSVQQEQSNNVGDNTLAVFGKTSPLTDDLEGTEDAAISVEEETENLMKDSVQQDQSSNNVGDNTLISFHYSPPSPTRPGLSASMHAPFPQSARIRTSSSPPEVGSSAGVRPRRPYSVYVPRTPPRSINASIHAPHTPPKKGLNASIHVPSQHGPMDPIPIPVIDLSPERRVRRVIDPNRECHLVVLVNA